MAILCLLGIFFVAYKVIEEEYVLLKAGSAIPAHQWRSFRMAKLATRNCCSFMVGVSLFFITEKVNLDIVLAVLAVFAFIQFAARIFYKMKNRTSGQSSSE